MRMNASFSCCVCCSAGVATACRLNDDDELLLAAQFIGRSLTPCRMMSIMSETGSDAVGTQGQSKHTEPVPSSLQCRIASYTIITLVKIQNKQTNKTITLKLTLNPFCESTINNGKSQITHAKYVKWSEWRLPQILKRPEAETDETTCEEDSSEDGRTV